MVVNWQNNNPANPADAANGPQDYDNHLYCGFGGVAHDNELAYLIHLCNLDRIAKDAAMGNCPLFFGEWSLTRQFNATDEFLKTWADAQKYVYGQDKGWIFWNFKVELTTEHYFERPPRATCTSYFEGLRRGYLTQDPAAYHNLDVARSAPRPPP
ncbi:hypothetical protein C8Q80DRAFT_1222485 [Daedaleopsis nitida]|nr:hypothetical protein C8Q80DRAFT_1222485 [Daedaleopsis nitida]